MLKSVLCAGVIISLVGLGACTKQGSAEKAGEKMDSAIETATTGKVDKKDGPLEKAGESVDQATGHKDKDPVDAVHDAIDNDPKTHP